VWRRLREDIGSGKDTDRVAYRELLADVASGAIDVIITYRLDRLSRNVRDVYDFLQRSADADVGFVSTSESFDTTTAMGRAMLGVAAVFAQLTREMIAENVRHGMAKRAESGKYTGTTGNPRFGYDYSPQEGKLLVNAAEAKVVRLAFELYAKRKWSLAKVARYLNREGYRTKKGRQWGTSVLAYLLRSSLYVGRIPYKGEEYEGEHEAIVDQALFDETQQMLEQRKWIPPRTQHSPHLLSGIARCGKCGWALRAHWQYHEGEGGRKTYRSYQHRGTDFVGKRACNGFTKSAEKLEALVIDAMRELTAHPDVVEAALAAARRQLATDAPAVRREADEIRGQLAEMGHRFEGWAARLDVGLIDEEQLRTHNEALLKDKARLQARLAELDTAAAREESLEIEIEQVHQALHEFGGTWGQLTFDEQRELLRSLIEHLRVWRDRAELKLLFMPPTTISLQLKRGPAKGTPRRSRKASPTTPSS